MKLAAFCIALLPADWFVDASSTNHTRWQDTGRAEENAVTEELFCEPGSVVSGLGGAEAKGGFPSMLHLLCGAMGSRPGLL